MSVIHTSVFKTNQTQAIRLPKAIALPDSIKTVDIVAIGNTRIITPTGESWDHWFAGAGASEDFMNEREQPLDQQRETL